MSFLYLDLRIKMDSGNNTLFFKDIQNSLNATWPEFADADECDTPDCQILNRHFKCINKSGNGLKFIAQDEHMPHKHLGYEERIYQHGLIATRHGNWHDFFNAMVWMNFPQSKVAINSIHQQEIQRQKTPLRSHRRDMLTLFDECGVIVIANKSVHELIKKHQWNTLFVKHKNLWLQEKIKLITFGHALYEKYMTPYIGMTAKALLIETHQLAQETVDEHIANSILQNKYLMTKANLSPLPLLGIPNWHKNQDDVFYANRNYFR